MDITMKNLRKATELTSLSELNMPARTLATIKAKNLSSGELVYRARQHSYSKSVDPSYRPRGDKWLSALASALDEAGYIRHDLDDNRAFHIGEFFGVYYGDYFTSDDETGAGIVCHMHQLGTNEQYETFRTPTDAEFTAIIQALQRILSPLEYCVIILRMGFASYTSPFLKMTPELEQLLGSPDKIENFQSFSPCDERHVHLSVTAEQMVKAGKRVTLEEVSCALNSTRESIKEIENRAIRKIRRKYPVAIRPIPCPDAIKYRLDWFFAKINVERAILGEEPLESPARRFVAVTADGVVAIEDLDLSIRATCCLKRQGLRTIGDILAYPKDKWEKVRNLGRHGMSEIEQQVQKRGYADFQIPVSQ